MASHQEKNIKSINTTGTQSVSSFDDYKNQGRKVTTYSDVNVVTESKANNKQQFKRTNKKSNSSQNEQLKNQIMSSFVVSYTETKPVSDRPKIEYPRNRVCKWEDRCTRENCNYVHCMSEIKVPDCRFYYQCNKMHGTFDAVNKVLDPSRKCFYRHDKETCVSYYARMGMEYPKLPEHRAVRTKFVKMPECQNLFEDEDAEEQVTEVIMKR